ncbi:1-phosphofructokinase, partial [Staphylococcus caprae]
NITVVDPDGTTTKLNAPGTEFTPKLRDALDALVIAQSENADWVVLAGSLPGGLEATYYAELCAKLRASG